MINGVRIPITDAHLCKKSIKIKLAGKKFASSRVHFSPDQN
jgi:hypothetical protein